MLRTARWRVPDLIGSLVAAGHIILATGACAEIVPNPLVARIDPPCVLDKCLQPPPSGAERPSGPIDSNRLDRGSPGRASASGDFDFYVLALSWSPGFCETGGAEKAPQQCEPGSRLGFVVHGLWPQNQHGYPSNCDTGSRMPSRLALDAVRGLYPDEGLARHEWRTHGTCSGKSPTDYFADVRQARNAIVIPPSLVAPDDQVSWAPLDIARAFAAANPRLRTDSMAVTCRQNMLEEVRICFTKDLRGYIACPEVVRASCRRPIEVPPVL